jgi:hypothetical protein
MPQKRIRVQIRVYMRATFQKVLESDLCNFAPLSIELKFQSKRHIKSKMYQCIMVNVPWIQLQ